MLCLGGRAYGLTFYSGQSSIWKPWRHRQEPEIPLGPLLFTGRAHSYLEGQMIVSGWQEGLGGACNSQHSP